MAMNVMGAELECCCSNPVTGFYRNGLCDTSPEDEGMHTVCALMTDEFLQFSKSVGNGLSTPIPEYGFPGLKAGDKWCLCMLRWIQARDAGFAPKVSLKATHISALEYVTPEELNAFAESNDGKKES